MIYQEIKEAYAITSLEVRSEKAIHIRALMVLTMGNEPNERMSSVRKLIQRL